MADLGAFAKFVISRFCGQFWSRRLRRNVVRCLHFKHLLLKVSWDFLRVLFRPSKSAFFFGRFSLGPPFAKSAKMANWGSFARFTITWLCGRFWSRRLRRNVLGCLPFKRMLIEISCDLDRLFFRLLKSAFFLGGFTLFPLLQNLRKWPIWVVLLNLT